MYEIFGMAVMGFLIGLTGAMAPGPTLVATINASMDGDWLTGLRISFGHAIVELLIVLLILFGLAEAAQPFTRAIAGVGGVALVSFGVLTIRGSRGATLRAEPSSQVRHPCLAGLVTSAANPYFWIWWLSIGSAMVIAGLEGGLVTAGAFLAGHWASDASWYTLVAIGVSKGSTLLSDTAYQRIMLICGIFLILFGVYYLVSFLV